MKQQITPICPPNPSARPFRLIGEGHNTVRAEKLFVSLNTVKTHSSDLFMKLEASRRTEAIRRAKELWLLPQTFR